MVHLLWIVLLFASIFMCPRYPFLFAIYLLFIVATPISWLVFGGCPLTALENYLTRKTGGKVSKSFLVNVLKNWFGIEVSSRRMNKIATGVVLFLTVVVIIHLVIEKVS